MPQPKPCTECSQESSRIVRGLCRRCYHKLWESEHPGQAATNARRWAKSHPKQRAAIVLARIHKDKAINPEKYKTREKERWRALTPEQKTKIYERAKKARRRRLGPPRKRTKMSEEEKKERKKAAYTQWRNKNPERVRELARESYHRNLDRSRETGRIYAQTRKARKQKLPSTLTTTQWQTIKDHYKNRCVYCGVMAPLTQDHVTPLSRGGPYTIQNIVPACATCNAKKHTNAPPKTIQTLLL